jgi:hypothetical protein
MVTISDSLRRFYIITNVVAFIAAGLAAIINVFVGPTNLAMWILPLAIAVFGMLILVMVDGSVTQANRPVAAWVRRLVGKRIASVGRYANVTNIRFVSYFFLTVEPVFFIVISVVLLIASCNGQINAGG